MSFDGLFTHAMVTELQGLLVGGRIAKIHQPYPQEVVLVIRSNGKTTHYYFQPTPHLRGLKLPTSRMLIQRRPQLLR